MNNDFCYINDFLQLLALKTVVNTWLECTFDTSKQPRFA